MPRDITRQQKLSKSIAHCMCLSWPRIVSTLVKELQANTLFSFSGAFLNEMGNATIKIEIGNERERERDSEWGDADEIDRPERRKQTLMLVVKEATTRIQFIDMHHSKGGVQRNNRDKCPLRRTRWDRCLSQQTFPPNLYVYVCFIKLSMRTPWKVAASEFFISFFLPLPKSPIIFLLIFEIVLWKTFF